jgi:uncharacterized protein YdeI (YjbR/CyaY-like superfamily)
MKNSGTVDEYIFSQDKWKNELIELRKIIKQTELTEHIKWGIPVYAINGRNVLGLAAFKAYVAIWFYQGALLTDTNKKLVNAQEGTTKAMRQWRFGSVEEIEPGIICEYIEEAIKNEKSGRRVENTPQQRLQLPDEILNAFHQHDNLQKNFEQLALSRQNEYIAYVDSAKKKETREKRMEMIVPLILRGLGLNDKYRNKENKMG